MIITRFAPSPTGFLHVGNLRTALINWLIAQQSRQTVGSKFILRIDDTDAERSREEYVDAIKQDLEWLGLGWDQVERQSLRMDRYNQVADELRDRGLLYECYETPVELDLRRKRQRAMGKPPVYDRSALSLTDSEKTAYKEEGRVPHWRFKLSGEAITWLDGIQGDKSIMTSNVSDPVLIRADGQFLYTLCSVIDDADFGITNVVRGDDHVTNTATQIDIFKVLGLDSIPDFAHHSLLTGAGGEGLSKRLGSLALKDLREQGMEPMALLSLLARLGSADPIEPRIAHQELIDGFDLGKFSSAPAKFDPEDLKPLSVRVLLDTDFESLKPRLAEVGIEDEGFWNAIKGNIEVLPDAKIWVDIAQNGAVSVIADEDKEFVTEALTLLPATPWDGTTWKSWTNLVKEKTGRKGKGLFLPLRKAMTAHDHGPDMAMLMPYLKRPQ